VFIFFPPVHNTESEEEKKKEMEEERVKFTNELGNEIEIHAKIIKKEDGKEGTVLVHYGMIGPTSEMGNTITWREATCLANLLKRLLEKR